MSQELINHSPDLRQLIDEGYHLEFKSGHLLVHHIPYVNSLTEIKMGTLVSTLSLKGNSTAMPETHVMHFIGEPPCNKDGSLLISISHSESAQNFGNGLIISRSFSNKPANGYTNYYEKFRRYAEIISAPAKSLDPGVTEKPYFPIIAENVDSVFQYEDTNSSRANIGFMKEKFKNHKVGIIGLGGTGAYILDLVAKTSVKEIRLFDNDVFSTHNAFRSPGAASDKELCAELPKVDYYAEKYSNMHKYIVPNKTFLYEDNIKVLNDLDFIFLAIDRNSSRKIIAEYLFKNKIPFVDVGLGVDLVDNKLTGVVRMSSFFNDYDIELKDRLPFDETQENMYNSNIQIAELNSINAAFAVIKWKKFIGFYQDLNYENHSLYCLNVNQLTDEKAYA